MRKPLRHQQNGRDHATKAALFAQTREEKEVLYDKLCGFEEKLQNEYKTLLN